MSAKHTPGPWRVSEQESGRVTVETERWKPIAAIVMRKADRSDCLANAHLIASAPELAASLNESLTWVIAWVGTNRDNPRAARSAIDHLRKFIAVLDKAGVDHGIRLDGLDVIEAAIARAEGGQS